MKVSHSLITLTGWAPQLPRPSAICTFSFRFPAVFGGFWVSRNLKTRNLETLKESLKASRKYLKITSVLKSLIIFWFFFMSNHSSWYRKTLLLVVGSGVARFLRFCWFLRFFEYVDMWLGGFYEMGPGFPSFPVSWFLLVFIGFWGSETSRNQNAGLLMNLSRNYRPMRNK